VVVTELFSFSDGGGRLIENFINKNFFANASATLVMPMKTVDIWFECVDKQIGLVSFTYFVAMSYNLRKIVYLLYASECSQN